MSSFISAAVDEAARLPDIQFPEFTAKLLTDTFDAIVAANLRQTESYIELVGAISKTLTDYINDTKDDISGAEVLEFLSTVVPPPDSTKPTKVTTGFQLNAAEASTLSQALALPGQAAPTVPTTVLTSQDVQAITEAVAKRLAANRYNLLKEMVKTGILRMIVGGGMLVSQLTFSTYASTFYTRNSSSYNTSDFTLNASAKTGRALSRWFNASASTKYQSVSVRTTNETQQDVAGSSVNIFGRVEINFRTDFQPLNQLQATENAVPTPGAIEL